MYNNIRENPMKKIIFFSLLIVLSACNYVETQKKISNYSYYAAFRFAVTDSDINNIVCSLHVYPFKTELLSSGNSKKTRLHYGGKLMIENRGEDEILGKNNFYYSSGHDGVGVVKFIVECDKTGFHMFPQPDSNILSEHGIILLNNGQKLKYNMTYEFSMRDTDLCLNYINCIFETESGKTFKMKSTSYDTNFFSLISKS